MGGYGEPSRLLLRYVEADWEDAFIPVTQEGMNHWFAEKKYNLGLDFPNLPYVIDGDVKLTQSVSVLRYLGRRFGLAPSEADINKADVFEQVIADLRVGLSNVCYSSPDIFDGLKAEFIENCPKNWKRLVILSVQDLTLWGRKLHMLTFW